MQALSPFIMIGLSNSFGISDIVLKSNSSSFNSKLRSLNTLSPFLIKCLGLRLSFFPISFNSSVVSGLSRYLIIL